MVPKKPLPQVRDEMEEAVKGCYDHSRVRASKQGAGWMDGQGMNECFDCIWAYTEICWTVGDYIRVSYIP